MYLSLVRRLEKVDDIITPSIIEALQTSMRLAGFYQLFSYCPSRGS
jgi:hypothetical protein